MLLGFQPALWGSVNVFYDQVASYALITVPLFIAMGYLAAAGKLSSNIFTSLNHWIGKIRGGIGIATVGSCTLFGTICGSSLVTASVFSLTSAPEMRKQGYDKSLAYGICASSGIIGMLIPPSILMVVYGVLSGDSVGKLLVAGITPGVMLAVFYSLTILILAKLKPQLIKDASASTLSLWEKVKELRHLWPVGVVVVVIFGGIFGGVFTPTEAGALATFIVLVLIIILEGKNSFPAIKSALADTARTSAMIYLIFGGSAIFSQFLVLSGLTTRFASFIIGLDLSVTVFMIIISLLYLVLGCLLESISMLSITIPLIYPVLKMMGIDPIYYAVVVIVAIHIGMITPPVGLCVYGAKAVAEKDVSLEDIFRGVIPFFLVSLLALLIFILFPKLSTFLPNLVFPW
jgi:tripartite ATP-independent transporter DctM subunit